MTETSHAGPHILPYRGIWPTIGKNVYIAPTATIIGDVTIGDESSIWFGTVIRGDVMPITIGARTNIQDNSVVHVTRRVGPTVIGSEVTIGHMVMLHACTIEDRAFIGMHATLLDHTHVASEGMVAAGAVLTPRKKVARHALWAGSPATLMRDMRAQEIEFLRISAENYVRLASEYRMQESPETP